MKESKNEVLEKKIFEKKSFTFEKEYYINSKLEFESSQSDNIENGNFNKLYKESKSKNKDEDKILYSENIRCKRILIEFSLIILIISFISLFGYFFIIERNFLDLQLILQTKTVHFHSNFICMYLLWILAASKFFVVLKQFANYNISKFFIKNFF